MNVCTSRLERGSSPVVGSSSNSSTGEVNSALASATFCCMPRERASIGSVDLAVRKPDTVEDLRDLPARRARAEPVEARRVGQVLRCRHSLEERCFNRYSVDQQSYLLGLMDDVVPEHAALAPPSGSSSVERIRTSVDLPEPFWPSTATHSPRPISSEMPARAYAGHPLAAATAAKPLLKLDHFNCGRQRCSSHDSAGRNGGAGDIDQDPRRSRRG